MIVNCFSKLDNSFEKGYNFSFCFNVLIAIFCKQVNIPCSIGGISRPRSTRNHNEKDCNLISSALFRFKRKAKKRPWNTSNTGLKRAQIERIFFRKKLQNSGTTILKVLTLPTLKFVRLVCRAKNKNKIRTYEDKVTYCS